MTYVFYKEECEADKMKENIYDEIGQEKLVTVIVPVYNIEKYI